MKTWLGVIIAAALLPLLSSEAETGAGGDPSASAKKSREATQLEAWKARREKETTLASENPDAWILSSGEKVKGEFVEFRDGVLLVKRELSKQPHEIPVVSLIEPCRSKAAFLQVALHGDTAKEGASLESWTTKTGKVTLGDLSKIDGEKVHISTGTEIVRLPLDELLEDDRLKAEYAFAGKIKLLKFLP